MEETEEDHKRVQHARRPPLPLQLHVHAQLILLTLLPRRTLGHHVRHDPPQPSLPPTWPSSPAHHSSHVHDVTAELAQSAADARSKCDGLQPQHGRGRCQHVLAILLHDDVMRITPRQLDDDVITSDVSVNARMSDERKHKPGFTAAKSE